MGRDDKSQSTSSQLGVCEKTDKGIVTSQNEICRRICGDRLGQRCKDGCMLKHTGEKGFRVVEHVHPDSPAVDAVVITTDGSITTLLYDNSVEVEQRLKLLAPFGLSEAEIEITKQVLQGYSNREIAEHLFISKQTLRTHLNNIYKKIPTDFKDRLLRRGHS